MKVSTTLIVLALASHLLACAEPPNKPDFKSNEKLEIAAHSEEPPTDAETPEAESNPTEILREVLFSTDEAEKDVAAPEEASTQSSKVYWFADCAAGEEGEGSEMLIVFVHADGSSQSVVKDYADEQCQIPAEETAQQS